MQVPRRREKPGRGWWPCLPRVKSGRARGHALHQASPPSLSLTHGHERKPWAEASVCDTHSDGQRLAASAPPRSTRAHWQLQGLGTFNPRIGTSCLLLCGTTDTFQQLWETSLGGAWGLCSSGPLGGPSAWKGGACGGGREFTPRALGSR